MTQDTVTQAVERKLEREASIHRESIQLLRHSLAEAEPSTILEKLVPTLRRDIINKQTWSNLPRSLRRSPKGDHKYRPVDIVEHLIFENFPIVDLEPIDASVFTDAYQLQPEQLLELADAGHIYLNLYARDPAVWAGRRDLLPLIEKSFSMGARIETLLRVAVPDFDAAKSDFARELQRYLDEGKVEVPRISRAFDPAAWVRRVSTGWAYSRLESPDMQFRIDTKVRESLTAGKGAAAEGLLNSVKAVSVSRYSTALGGELYEQDNELRDWTALGAIKRSLQGSDDSIRQRSKLETEKQRDVAEQIQRYLLQRYRGLPPLASAGPTDDISCPIPWPSLMEYLGDSSVQDERAQMRALTEVLRAEISEGRVKEASVFHLVDQYDKLRGSVDRMRDSIRKNTERGVRSALLGLSGMAVWKGMYLQAGLLFGLSLLSGVVVENIALWGDKVLLRNEVDDLLLLATARRHPVRRVYQLTTYPLKNRRGS